jgi:limonene-1,2-epoxide hydrolase
MLRELIVARIHGREEGRAFWDRSQVNLPEGAHLDIVVIVAVFAIFVYC